MRLGVAVFLQLAASFACAGFQEPAHEGPLLEQLQKAPLSPRAKDRARRALIAKDYLTVEQVLVQEIESDPKAADLLTLAARVFLVDKNPANAAIALKKAEKLRPLSEADRFELVMAYLGLKRGAWARPELERLAAGSPGNPLYPYWLARLDYDDRLYDSAVTRLRAVTIAHPKFLRAWDNLGLNLEMTGQLDEAVSCYQRAVALNREQKPASPWPPLNLGALLTKLDQLKEAEAVLREAAGYGPGLSEVHYRLGVNLHKQASDDAAIVELKRASELDPASPEPLYTLGQIYRARGDAKAAGEAFEKFNALKKEKRGS